MKTTYNINNLVEKCKKVEAAVLWFYSERTSDAKGYKIGSLHAFGVLLLKLFDAANNTDRIDFSVEFVCFDDVHIMEEH